MTDELKIQVRFPADIWLAVKRFAREDDLSFNAEVLWILRHYASGRRSEIPMLEWPNVTPRFWQEDLTKRFRADWTRGKRHWLIEVTPGGGKTLWALLTARWLLSERLIKRVVILCPTIHIRDQWLNHYRKLVNVDGMQKWKESFPPILQLAHETNTSGAVETSDFHGVVLTYQQLASGDGVRHQKAACRSGTLVIADEIHHVGRDRTYGKAYIEAFGQATAQMGLTGTAWTSEGAGPIPFVEYDEQGVVKNDGYKYTRRAAITDDVLRASQFFGFDGEVRLQNLDDYPPMEHVQNLSDAGEDRSVLDACLYPGNPWMQTILKQADAHLLGIIQGSDGDDAVPDAKGLVATKSQVFAEMIQAQLITITGQQTIPLITSYSESAEADLDAFKQGKLGRWAVSMKMFSEGVDDPSLFVGVYVSNINTDKFWRQFVGRFERKRHPDERRPAIYFPATPTLMGIASAMDKEVPQALEGWELPERERRPEPGPGREQDYRETGPAELHSVIDDDKVYRPDEHKESVALLERYGVPTRYALKMAEALRAARGQRVESTSSADKEESTGFREEHIDNRKVRRILREELNQLVRQVAYLQVGGSDVLVGERCKNINAEIVGKFNKRDKMTIEQLKAARDLMKSRRDKLVAKS